MSDVRSSPAGWYPDPEGPTALRYWDGTAWTQHQQPYRAALPGDPPTPAAPSGVVPTLAPAQNVPALVGLILAIVGVALGSLSIPLGIVATAGGIVSIFGVVRANRMRRAGRPNHRQGIAIAGIVAGFCGGLIVGLLRLAIGVIVSAVESAGYPA